jgi:5-methylcytosine-specific restriction endonuclease McrA
MPFRPREDFSNKNFYSKKGKKIKREKSAFLSMEEKRKIVYERDGYKCVECGSEENLTLDHTYPRSRGGDASVENFQTMCETCNKLKGNKII